MEMKIGSIQYWSKNKIKSKKMVVQFREIKINDLPQDKNAY